MACLEPKIVIKVFLLGQSPYGLAIKLVACLFNFSSEERRSTLERKLLISPELLMKLW